MAFVHRMGMKYRSSPEVRFVQEGEHWVRTSFLSPVTSVETGCAVVPRVLAAGLGSRMLRAVPGR